VYLWGYQLLTSWRNARETREWSSSQHQNLQNIVYTRLDAGYLKCNVNASLSRLHNKVRIGVCVRDESGKFILAKTVWLWVFWLLNILSYNIEIGWDEHCLLSDKCISLSSSNNIYKRFSPQGLCQSNKCSLRIHIVLHLLYNLDNNWHNK
jgi:hypothetical protein